jgi:hypothetical protein
MATNSEPTPAQSLEEKVVLITGGRRVGGELALLMASGRIRADADRTIAYNTPTIIS